jgi:hypothetical protein
MNVYSVFFRKIRSLRSRLRLADLQRRFRHRQTSEKFEINWRLVNYNRISVINLILADRPNSRYLEIGCFSNDTFDSVIASDKTGVDPEKGGTHRCTSDEFFASCGEQKWDVIFIDGLHTYEQVSRDVRNALRCLSANGWIILHDMFPRDWLEEHVPLITNNAWTGDVWKVGFELAQSVDIEFKLMKIDMGVGVVRPKNENPIIPDLTESLSDKRFSYFHQNVGQLPLVSIEEGREWIMNNRRGNQKN